MMKRAILSVAVLWAAGCGDSSDDSGSPAIDVPSQTQMPGAQTPQMPAAGQGGTMTPVQMQPVPMDGQSGTPTDGTGTPMPGDGTMGDGTMDDMTGDGTMGDGTMDDMTGDGTMMPATGDGPPGTVSIEFSTLTYGGEYAPKNYVAAWIEDGSGGFVKTVQRSAGDIHASDLVGWTAASGGWGFSFLGSSNPDMVDAVSTPTLQTHQAHSITWNLKDGSGAVVPDGNYTVVLEVTESRARDRAGPLARIDFVKGAQAQTVERPDDEAFENVVVHFEP
jgi:hypothetical protein